MPQKKNSDMRNIGFEISRKCNINCLNCISNSNNTYYKKLTKPQIKNILKQIKDTHFDSLVSITGGEPFLFIKELTYTLGEASRLKLKTGIPTNAYWGSTLKNALAIMHKVTTYGTIDILALSTDIFHEQFIPFNRIVNAVKACTELNIEVWVRTIHIGITKKNKLATETALRKRLKKHGLKNINVISFPLVITDELKSKIKSMAIKLNYTSQLPVNNACGAMKDLFIDLNGYVYVCCCNVYKMKYRDNLILGNIYKEPLKDIFRNANSNFMLNLLKRYGPQELLHLIREILGTDYNLSKNIQKNDICHLCYRIFSSDKLVNFLTKMRTGQNNWAA